MSKLAASLLVGVMASVSAQALPANHGARLDGVVAVVDDSTILQSELDARLALPSALIKTIADPIERQRRMRQLVAKTLDQMVEDELIVHAAVAAKLEPSDAEVDAAIDEIKKQNDLGFEWFAAALEAQGYTLETYRRELARSLSRTRAIDQFVEPRVHVSDEDVRAFYGELSRRSPTPLGSFEHVRRDLRDELHRRELEVKTARWVQQLRRAANVVLED